MSSPFHSALDNTDPDSHTAVSRASVDILFIDYQYVRMYVSSVGIQTLVESMGKDPKATTQEGAHTGAPSSSVLITEVIDAAGSILSKTVSLARRRVLRYCPARTFSRITSACIFLLKALGLSKLGRESFSALHLLDECLEVLLEQGSDNEHPWDRYAVLIRRYSDQVRCRSEPSVATVPAAMQTTVQSSVPVQDMDNWQNQNSAEFDEFCQAFGSSDGYIDDLLTDQWSLDLDFFDPRAPLSGSV